MTIKRLTLFSFLLTGILFTSACKKEGPVGPAGADGNANVRSEIISVLSSHWDGGASLYTAVESSNVITENIFSTGAVLCYLRSGDGNVYTPLPFSINYGSYTTHMGFEYVVGEIAFFFQDDDALTPAPGNRTFKVVAIESRTLEANPEITDMDYADAMRVLGLDR